MPLGKLAAKIRESATAPPEDKTKLPLNKSKANEPTSPIQAAPATQDTEAQEKELDELIEQLKQVNRHWKVEWAREKKVPLKALLHAANLWLSDDTDDWSAANNTIFQFTSQWGRKQLCYPRAEKVAIPEITHK